MDDDAFKVTEEEACFFSVDATTVNTLVAEMVTQLVLEDYTLLIKSRRYRFLHCRR